MKKFYKYASTLFLTGVFAVMMAANANAQRGVAHASGGGGGGGATFSRGGGGGSIGGGGYSRVGIGYGYRPAYGYGYRNDLALFGYPSLGFYYNSLPYGYYPFYMGAAQFYYYNGIFYRPYNDGYVVTAPPVGAAVPGLPKGAKAIMIDNQQFFEYNGVYYKIIINDKGDKVYVVAGKDGVLNTDKDNAVDDGGDYMPRVGDVVDQLPDGSRKLSLNGKKYFVSADGIYYEEIKDKNGNIAYRIASVSDEQ